MSKEPQWSDAPETAPDPSSPTAPEVSPSNAPIVDHDARAPEVVTNKRSGQIAAYEQSEFNHEPQRSPQRMSSRKICGLRPVTFWLAVVLAVVVMAAAVGGGVGGSLASSDNATGSPSSSSSSSSSATAKTSLTAQSSSEPPASLSSTSASSSTGSAVTSGSTGLAALSCTDDSVYTTSSGSQYREFCFVNWPAGLESVGGGSESVEDVSDVITYTFEDCMDACDSYNRRNDGGCNAVTYDQNLTTSVAHNNGNCVLKSAQGATNPSYEQIASAALLQ